jgi:hypothetical protein
MAFTSSIDAAKRAMLLVAEGEVTDEQLLAAARVLVGDPQFDPSYRLFSDFSGVVSNKITADSISQLHGIYRPTTTLHAVLATRALEYGLTRMYEAYCQIHGVIPPRIFFGRDEALAFLNEGLPADQHLA